MSKVKEFPVGGLWDLRGWELHVDKKLSQWDHDCPHCHSHEGVKEIQPSGRVTYQSWVCPRVIVAYNEAGSCTTGVCLDCILEAIQP